MLITKDSGRNVVIVCHSFNYRNKKIVYFMIKTSVTYILAGFRPPFDNEFLESIAAANSGSIALISLI